MVTATATAHPYLARRGLEHQAPELGWSIKPLGENAAKYGFAATDADTQALWIPYRQGFERIRIIDDADISGGRYRQPTRQGLALYDPDRWLEVRTARHAALLLIEGEINLASVRCVMPDLPMVGLPGKLALKPDLAAEIAAALDERHSTVWVWIDRHDADPRGFENALNRIAGNLHAAGVNDVLVVPDTGTDDSNDLLVELGRDRARRRFDALLRQAEHDGPYTPPPRAEPSRTSRPARRPSHDTPVTRALEQLQALTPEEYLPRLYPDVEFVRGYALCPFHDERSPSLHAVGRRFHCFGCGMSGDVLDAAAVAWSLDVEDDFRELIDLLASMLLGRRAI